MFDRSDRGGNGDGAMKNCLVIVCLAFGMTVLAQVPNSPDEFSYARREMQLSKSIAPQGGFVPDAATAIAIAHAVTIPIYGRSQVDAEKPLRAQLKDGRWLVIGTLPPGSVGGTLVVEIGQDDGRIRYMNHFM